MTHYSPNKTKMTLIWQSLPTDLICYILRLLVESGLKTQNFYHAESMAKINLAYGDHYVKRYINPMVATTRYRRGTHIAMVLNNINSEERIHNYFYFLKSVMNAMSQSTTGLKYHPVLVGYYPGCDDFARTPQHLGINPAENPIFLDKIGISYVTLRTGVTMFDTVFLQGNSKKGRTIVEFYRTPVILLDFGKHCYVGNPFFKQIKRDLVVAYGPDVGLYVRNEEPIMGAIFYEIQ
jgi:hypothetical protein